MTDVIDKIDLKTFIGDLEKEEKPKTLEEIYREVGFPFSAKVVADVGRALEPKERGFPIGTVLDVHERSASSPHRFIAWEAKESFKVDATLPRWQLLGHKT